MVQERKTLSARAKIWMVWVTLAALAGGGCDAVRHTTVVKKT